MGKGKTRRKKHTAYRPSSRIESSQRETRKRAADRPTPSFWWLTLGLIASIAYINAAHGVVVFDDQELLAGGAFENLRPQDFLAFFSQSLWEANGNETHLYRPHLLVMLGLQWLVFGQWWAGYHLVNIGLHLAATLLIFGFAREAMRRFDYPEAQAHMSAWMASAVFAVHPVLTDAVNSVFNGSEIYVTICLVGALWYLLLNARERPVRAWLVVSLLYFVGLGFRENAAVLPALAALMLWMTSCEPWRQRLIRCLPVVALIVPLAIYAGLRTHALDPAATLPERSAPASAVKASEARPVGAVPGPSGESESGQPAPLVKDQLADRSLVEKLGVQADVSRVGRAAALWADGLGKVVWPHPLVVLHTPSETPVWFAVLLQSLLMLGAGYAWWRGRPVFATGLGFFYLAILPSSRIVSENALPPLLLERMLYLPSAGLVLLLAGGLCFALRKYSLHVTASGVVVLLVLLLPVTWARNADWSNELRLLEGDLLHEPGSRQLVLSVVRANVEAGRPEQSARLCEQSESLLPTVSHLARECGRVYALQGDRQAAEAAFLQAIRRQPGNSWNHFELARLYAADGRRDEAMARFEMALARERFGFIHEIMTAIMLLDVWPGDPERRRQAKAHLETALELQPRSAVAMQLLAQLN